VTTAALVLVLALALLTIAHCCVLISLKQQMREGHSAYVKQVSAILSREYGASILEQAARDWDSTDERPNLQRLARDEYKPGGPSMPTIWLRDRAKRIRGGAQ